MQMENLFAFVIPHLSLLIIYYVFLKANPSDFYFSFFLYLTDIDGLDGMRPIYGITVAEEKVKKLVREDKVH